MVAARLRLRLRALELGALLVAIYVIALTYAVRGMPSSRFAVAVAFDLMVTASVATWWLGVRCGLLSRRAPFIVFGLGALLSRLILPSSASNLAFALSVGLEAFVIALVIVRAPRLLLRLRRDARLPAIIRLADGLEDVGVPRWLARVLATEVTTVALALTGWFRRAGRGFSVHRTHHSLAIHVLIGLLIALETVAFHLLLARLTVVGAWVATGLSLYALVWLLGDAHALRLGRVRLDRDELVIEIARRWAAVIPRDSIVAARRSTTLDPGTLDLAVETPTVVLELSAPVTARGPFGLTRSGCRVALTVDDAPGFLAALERGSDAHRAPSST